MRFRKLKKQTKHKKAQLLHNEALRYTSIPNKIKAFITDMFMIYMPILYLITYVVLNGKDDFQSSNWAPFVAVSLYALISSILLSQFGQTPGNKAYTMKVVDVKSHENISFLQGLLRFVSFLFGATILIGFFVPFYKKDKSSLHDIIARTVVIDVKD